MIAFHLRRRACARVVGVAATRTVDRRGGRLCVALALAPPPPSSSPTSSRIGPGPRSTSGTAAAAAPRREQRRQPRRLETTRGDVGAASKAAAAPSGRPAASEAQRRSARLELDRTTRSTDRLLSLPIDIGGRQTTIDDAVVNECRVALRYWSRRWYMHFHPGFGRAAKGEAVDTADALRSWRWGDANDDRVGHDDFNDDVNDDGAVLGPGEDVVSGDHGARRAERLLDWAVSANLVPRGIFDPPNDDGDRTNDPTSRSPNSICVNIVETYLLPTAYGGAGGAEVRARAADTIVAVEDDDDDHDRHGSTSWGDDDRVALAKRRAIDYSARVRAVADATRAMNKMRRMHVDYPEHIYPDSLGVKAELNVWSKRAMLLGEERRRRDSFDRTGGLGVAGVVVSSDGVGGGDVVVVGDPAEMLRRLERRDASAGGRECDDDGREYDAYGGGGGGGDLPYGPDAYTSQGCIERMETILADAEAAYVSTRDEGMRPCSDWYNHVLGAWARSDDVAAASRRTREILRGMEAYADAADAADADAIGGDGCDDDRRMRYLASPDTVSYNIVLFCLARCGADAPGRGGAREAESMFRRLEDRYRRTGDLTIRPDRVTYGLYCLALARAGLAPEAEGVLDSLEDEQQRRDDEENDDDDGTRAAAAVVVPSLTIYNTVLNAWANSRRRDAPMRAESLLERMRILSSTGRNPGVEPDSISVSTVISCHARSRTRRGAERGERMLDDAIDMYSRGNSRVKPDSIMFNCAITGWTNISGVEVEQRGVSRHDIPAERAEALLRKMKDLRLEIQPCAHTYNHILDCWAKSEIKGCADRAVKLFREMHDPDDFSYNTLLHAMSKESDQWVSYVEDILHEMKDKKVLVSQVTYHGMMNVFAKSSSRDGAKKAEEFLRGMAAEGLSLSEMSYNICIDAYARRGDHRKAQSLVEEMLSLSDRGNIECRPSIHSFASVVNALAKSGDMDAVARAEEVIRTAEGLDYVSPNSILYNSLIDCIVKSRHKDNSLQAEEILVKMEQMHRSGNPHVRPNSYAYSMVLTCCARSKELGSAERAERILLNMESLYSEGLSDVIANSRCYSAAITAWARSNSPDAVERTFALIDRMEQNGRDRSPHGKPNAHCYNACIHAIAKSQLPGKVRRCREVLQRMIAAKDDGFHESAPSFITYSTIINACAFTSGNEDEKQEAFDLARSCFQTLLESADMEPCASSFTNFFLVISRHLKQGAVRDQFAEAVFREGCRRGKMNKQALDSFRKASPLVSDRILSEQKGFPAEWRRSISNDGYKLQ